MSSGRRSTPERAPHDPQPRTLPSPLDPGDDDVRPPRAPRRDEIERSTVGVVKKGTVSKADLLLVDVGEGKVLVKDFAAKPGWSRLSGRIQISREAAAYRWLVGVEGIPRTHGRIDPHALALEWIDAEQLSVAPNRFEDVAGILARLSDLVFRIHARGVTHNDLRSRENVLLRGDGALFLVDFAGAIRLRPGGWAHRLLFRAISGPDRSALLKWKEILAPETITDAEREALRRFARRRALWPVNRKNYGRRRAP